MVSPITNTALSKRVEFCQFTPAVERGPISAQGLPNYLQNERKRRKETTQLQMPANSLLRLEGDNRGIQIVCHSRSCWITQEGDSKDYLLNDKRDFTGQRNGLIVVQALTDTELVLSSKKESHSAV